LKSCQEAGGKLVLLNPQKAVQEVLEVTHLATVIEIYDTEESARDAFM
jgi:anti-anti-sigma factor